MLRGMLYTCKSVFLFFFYSGSLFNPIIKNLTGQVFAIRAACVMLVCVVSLVCIFYEFLPLRQVKD